MSGLDLAAQMRVYAALCDAVDPNISDDDQIAALETAHEADADFAFTAGMALFRHVMRGLGDQFGQPVVADMVTQLRTACISMPLIRDDDGP